jgi:hypothetical protein
MAALVFAYMASLFLVRCVEVIFPLRGFLRGKKGDFSAVFDYLPNALSFNSREFGVFFGAASGRCRFPVSYGVFWAEFLPMHVSVPQN